MSTITDLNNSATTYAQRSQEYAAAEIALTNQLEILQQARANVSATSAVVDLTARAQPFDVTVYRTAVREYATAVRVLARKEALYLAANTACDQARSVMTSARGALDLVAAGLATDPS